MQSHVVAPLSNEGGRLLEESSSWAQTFGGLGLTWRRSPHAEERGPFTYIRDSAISTFLAGLVADCREEMLTAQPQSGRDPQSLAAAALRDTALLERGCSMRTLYQHSARRNTVTQRVRRRGQRAGSPGPHAGRVLQPAHRHRPPRRGDPGRLRT